MGIVWITVAVVAGIGIIAAIMLYIAAKRFHVPENPLVSEVEDVLPGANCGSCGHAGCHAFAVACATATSLENLYCPGCGSAGMKKIASIVGLAPAEKKPEVAMVRCNGSCASRGDVVHYDGVRSCAIEASTFSGETACAYGCLGCGDCESACPFDAIHMDPESHLPVVDFNKCVGCGKCAEACPRGLIALVEKKSPLVWVSCMNHDKGAVAMKECDVACIGCGKCMKACSHGAVKVNGFVASINQEACVGCGECAEVCPRGSILVRK